MKGYLSELNAQAEEERARHAAVKQAQTAAAIAAARERFTPLDVRLGRLLSTIPPEVQAEGLSIVAVQVKLRPRGTIPLAATLANWLPRCGGSGSCASGAGMTADRASARCGASARADPTVGRARP